MHEEYIKSSDGHTDHLVDAFRRHDSDHVWEKLRQWQSPSSLDRSEESTAESLTPESQYPSVDHASDDMTILAQRLASANTRRREQLQYWTRHPDRANEQQQQQSSIIREPSTALVTNVQADSDAQIMRTTQVQHPMSESTSAKASATSFSSVPLSTIDDNLTAARTPRTEYTSSQHGHTVSKTRVPDLPPKTSDGTLTMNCPYCFTELEHAAMQDRNIWK